MKYRAEIDGLRAVAVVPVILFHAGFDSFSGGFVGVDVFFVISGYLITSILIKDIEAGRFSILKFYERRARRILPALFFVMAACIPFAWMWMYPTQMKEFSQSLVAVSVFVSNFFFLRKSGYFESDVEMKPLLHTWSLAVEEQYYLVFPVFLFLVWRYGKQRVFWMIVALAAVSLLFSEWGWRKAPDANFFLAPSRVWELFSGSISAFLVQKHGVRPNNILSLLGLAAIVFSIFAYDGTTPFPSVYALVPVVGVVLLVLFCDRSTLAGRLLSTKPFVGIGLISYSAYLWHQPLLAFARIRFKDTPPPELMLGLSALALVLAAFSWRYVESPFRGQGALIRSRSRLFALSLSGLGVFVLLGLTGHVMNGYDYRLTAAQRQLLAFGDGLPEKYYREGTCFLTAEQNYQDFVASCLAPERSGFFVWGDSHAAALATGFGGLDAPMSQYTASACPPLLDTDITIPPRPNCRGINNFILGVLAENPDVTVVLHANWILYDEDYETRLANTISRIRSVGVTRIIVVGGVPQYKFWLPVLLLEAGVVLDSPHVGHYDQRKIREKDQEIREISTRMGAEFLSAVNVLCPDDECVMVIGGDGHYAPTIWDGAHLTYEGAVYLDTRLFGSGE